MQGEWVFVFAAGVAYQVAISHRFDCRMDSRVQCPNCTVYAGCSPFYSDERGFGMSRGDQILSALSDMGRVLCDDCLGSISGIDRHYVNKLCRDLATSGNVRRSRANCSMCWSTKECRSACAVERYAADRVKIVAYVPPRNIPHAAIFSQFSVQYSKISEQIATPTSISSLAFRQSFPLLPKPKTYTPLLGFRKRGHLSRGCLNHGLYFLQTMGY